MARYVALLRGIMPTNPNMKGAKLKGVLEKLGYTNVQTVIASGNVIFDSPSKNIPALEKKIEAAWPKMLGFKSTTIVWSQSDIEKLIEKKPFKNKTHSKRTYLLVTFLKYRQQAPGGVLFAAIDLTDSHTPDLMKKAEKEHGKEITTRTWKTVERIYAKMQS